MARGRKQNNNGNGKRQTPRHSAVGGSGGQEHLRHHAAREAVTSFLIGRARFLERHLPEALKYDFAEQTEL